VVPTYQRRSQVLACVQALDAQRFTASYEVVVVEDGSTDGTARALRELDLAVPLTVIEQENLGAAAARNRGAAAARGTLLLFLDDDMEADADLLYEHDRLHRAGANAVVGHIPLHPESPASPIADGVREWAEGRLKRLAAPDGELTLHDLLTGQLSLSRALFERVGGFDTNFTQAGSFGGEDLDLGYRLQLLGCRIVFAPLAVTWQRYVVSPERYLRQWCEAGRSDVAFARKHPERAADVVALAGTETRAARRVWRPLLGTPVVGSAMRAVLRLGAIHACRASAGPVAKRLIFLSRRLEHLQGVREAGGLPSRGPIVALAYHAIADLDGDPVLGPYAVPPDEFDAHLVALRQRGYRFVDLDEVKRTLSGRPRLGSRGVMLTFDDCTEDLLSAALPVLERHQAPAAAFAVSGSMGGTNHWDTSKGARTQRLLDAAQLRSLGTAGVEIGAHSQTHSVLTQVPEPQMRREILGSVSDLTAAGVPRPRAFAYPYGAHDHRVREAVRGSGLCLAFTVEPGRIEPSVDAYAVPRVEVLRGDGPTGLTLKVWLARTRPALVPILDRFLRKARGA